MLSCFRRFSLKEDTFLKQARLPPFIPGYPESYVLLPENLSLCLPSPARTILRELVSSVLVGYFFCSFSPSFFFWKLELFLVGVEDCFKFFLGMVLGSRLRSVHPDFISFLPCCFILSVSLATILFSRFLGFLLRMSLLGHSRRFSLFFGPVGALLAGPSPSWSSFDATYLPTVLIWWRLTCHSSSAFRLPRGPQSPLSEFWYFLFQPPPFWYCPIVSPSSPSE